MLPGVMVWSTFFVAVFFSFWKPLWAIFFVIFFDLYWFIRVLYLMVYLIISYRRFRRTVRVDWQARCEALPESKGMMHLIILPTYKEPELVIRSTFESLIRSRFPNKQMMVVLAIEERDRENATAIAENLRHDFGDRFGHFLVAEHPARIEGEIAGKGSNIAWAGRRAKEYIDANVQIPYERIIVSSFDVDTQPHEQYFSHLTFLSLTHPDPTHTSFQPVPLFNNNLWQSPSIMRVAANATTFWMMTEQLRPERLFTFASHSMSFRALVDVDFWQNDIVTEDSRIFLQCLFRYDGKYSVTPMYIPVSMDTVLGRNWWASLKNLYKQQQRWAYGIENFPYMAWNFARATMIPWNIKFRYMWNQLEGIYSWATAPILIFVLGRLPLVVGKERLASSIVAQNAPEVLQFLMTISMVGLLVCAVLSTTLVPPRPAGSHRAKTLLILLQWILFPVVMIAFGSIPATDAQTRLMLGKYLGFRVTEKRR